MELAAPVILTLLVIGIPVFAWLSGRGRKPVTNLSFVPTNQLEERLLASVGSELTPEMTTLLSSSVLLGVESAEAPGEPISFSGTFPQDFAEWAKGQGAVLNPAGKLELGPWVVCFSSPRIVYTLGKDPFLGELVTAMGEVREFTAQEIFRSSLKRELDVVLNPFYGVSRRFSQAELRELLSEA